MPKDHNYKVLLIRREMSEVLASQKKMLHHRGESAASTTEDAQMAEHFENDLWRASYLLKNAPHFQFLELNYRDVVAHPEVEAERIRAFLGMDLEVKAMSAAVDRQLYRNRARTES